MCSSEYLVPPTGLRNCLKIQENQIRIYPHNSTVHRFLGAFALSQRTPDSVLMTVRHSVLMGWSCFYLRNSIEIRYCRFLWKTVEWIQNFLKRKMSSTFYKYLFMYYYCRWSYIVTEVLSSIEMAPDYQGNRGSIDFTRSLHNITYIYLAFLAFLNSHCYFNI